MRVYFLSAAMLVFCLPPSAVDGFNMPGLVEPAHF